MSNVRVLILGHSFVRRLREFITQHDPEYDLTLGLEHITVRWHGVGGRTIAKLNAFDLTVVEDFKPDIVFLQIGSNDLTQRNMSHISVGSRLEEFVRQLHDEQGVKIIIVGQTIQRAYPVSFNAKVSLLARYMKTVLEPLSYTIYWSHRGFWRPRGPFLSFDGVHLNREGQHKFYRSVRGAVLRAVRQLRDSQQ
jgi:lysophospholipase L1-like esterase